MASNTTCPQCNKSLGKEAKAMKGGKWFHSRCMRNSIRSKAEDHFKYDPPDQEPVDAGFEWVDEPKSGKKSGRGSLRWDKSKPTVLEYTGSDGGGSGSREKSEKKSGSRRKSGSKKDTSVCAFCGKSVKSEGSEVKIVKGQAICMSCRMEGRKLD